MYTPKISDDLIRRLYHLAKARGIPMTHLVNELLENALADLLSQVNDPATDYQAAKPQSEGRDQ